MSAPIINSFGQLKAIVSSSIEENDELEFKKEFNRSYNEKNKQLAREVATDLVQFSNRCGGNLIYGIDEVRSRASGLTPLGYPGGAAGVEEAIRKLLANWTDPRIDPTFYKVVRGGDEFLVVRVEPSIPPVAVCDLKNDRNQSMYIEYPFRSVREIRKMTPAEVLLRATDPGRANMLRLMALGNNPATETPMTRVARVYFQTGNGPTARIMEWGTHDGEYATLEGFERDTFSLVLRRLEAKEVTTHIPYQWLSSAWRDRDGPCLQLHATLWYGPDGNPERFMPVV